MFLQFIIKVPTATTLNILTTSLPGAEVNDVYDESLIAIGGTASYTWSIIGTLPTGITLNIDNLGGVITAAPANYSFSLRVQDSVGEVDIQPVSILITPDQQQAPPPLVILNNATLNSPEQNLFYSVIFSATGGVPGYTWSKTSGSFPTGLTLAGSVLSGTPTVLGTSNFLMRVTDSAIPPVITEKSFTIQVIPAGTGPSYPYYESLIIRPDHVASYSLRNEAQINQYRGGNPPYEASYNPAGDTDPRKQDAMKIAIQGVSLRNQVWLPSVHIPHTSIMMTWDAWYGAEFAFSNAHISGYKAWNLCSPNAAIYTEIQALFSLAQSLPGALAMTTIRQYNGMGPNTITMGGKDIPLGSGNFARNYGNTSIGPMMAEFGIAPQVWTRTWLYLDFTPTWYLMYLWLADSNRNPIQIYNGLQVKPQEIGVGTSIDGTWDILRIEYNTSTSAVSGTRPLVSYARNVVTLRGITLAQVQSILTKPTAGGV